MKKTILLLLAFTILTIACSSSDDPSDPNGKPNESSFSVELSGNANVGIDETFPLSITGNETIRTLQASLDDFQTTILNRTIDPTGFGTNTTLYFSFDILGSKTISIKAINANGNESTKTFNVSVIRGDAVKIIGAKLISFSNINNTWDAEFPSTDENRLADVFLFFRKARVNILDNFNFTLSNWFKSSIKQNQGDLTWDLSSENLYISPLKKLLFSMADDDGGGVVQDLMLGPPFEREVSFQEHITNKPETITLSVSEIDLEVVLTVEWN